MYIYVYVASSSSVEQLVYRKGRWCAWRQEALVEWECKHYPSVTLVFRIPPWGCYHSANLHWPYTLGDDALRLQAVLHQSIQYLFRMLRTEATVAVVPAVTPSSATAAASTLCHQARSLEHSLT